MTTAVSPTTDREAWLQERRKGIGASEASICLGLSGSRLKLYLDKTGQLEPYEPSEEQRWGLRLEPLIADAYQERTGRAIIATQRFHRHPEWDWMTATLDAINDDMGIVEFKSVGPHGHGARLGDDGDTETLPDAWWAQGHHQMMVMGQDHMEFAVFGPGLRLRIYPMHLSSSLCDTIVEETGEFWTNHVVAGVPPDEIEPEDAAMIAKLYRRQSGEILLLDERAECWAREWRAMGTQIGAMEKEREVLRGRLLMALGNADGAETTGGLSIFRKVVTVNHKASEARTSEQVRITVKEPKE